MRRARLAVASRSRVASRSFRSVSSRSHRAPSVHRLWRRYGVVRQGVGGGRRRPTTASSVLETSLNRCSGLTKFASRISGAKSGRLMARATIAWSSRKCKGRIDLNPSVGRNRIRCDCNVTNGSPDFVEIRYVASRRASVVNLKNLTCKPFDSQISRREPLEMQ